MSTPAIKPLFIRMHEADNVVIIGVISPGDKLTQKNWAERWKLHNALVLLNPAPVT